MAQEAKEEKEITPNPEFTMFASITIPTPKHAHSKEYGENISHIVEMHFADEDEAHAVIKMVREAKYRKDEPL